MKPLSRALAALFLFALSMTARATHNEAGEITICYVGDRGQPLYEVTIFTHTNPASPADRPEFILDWGDNRIDTIPRTSSQVVTVAGVQVQRNLYVARHLYPGPGVFLLQYIDPNRVAGVVNIPGSVTVPMCVQTQLIIGVSGNNCSPRFLNAPIQNACLGQPWIHNPGAYDSDGDSLSFEPRVCLGGDQNGDGIGDPIPGYRYPDGIAPGANNRYGIDPVTGTISWISPQEAGIYNIAFAVKEWRRLNGVMREIGYVVRDMQVIVGPCNDRPPVIAALRDTCVEAGTNLSFQVRATDPDAGQTITLSALGGPFAVTSPAVFNSTPAQNTVNGVFSWGTTCAHVRQQPYQVVFNARDNYNQVQLQDVATVFITVVAPAPRNPSATPNASRMQLHWDASICSNATGYLIYRRQGSYGFTPGHCETGVPAYTGYTFIGSTTGLNNTSYTDEGLSFGITYCYMVVAVFPDGAQSYASVEFCAMLDRDVPIMTNVSVGVTDVTSGVDTVRWSNAHDLDTLQYPGPYQFKVYRGSSYTTATDLVHTSALSPFLTHPDTVFIDRGIDTRTTPHAYRVELYSGNGNTLVGPSNTASSVYLVADPNDKRVTLLFNHSTPWLNTRYDVYRQNGAAWDLIATTPETTYVDTGLTNGREYCYYVKSTGAYDDPDIVAPLINFSQEVCATPVDRTPPCAPTVQLDNDCGTPLNTLTWNNPNNSCADDTYRYNIYFTDSLGGPLELIASIVGAEDTVFTHTDGSSVAGCYAVTAIDTVGNESALSDTVCGDNCPDYRLPNVFTPNNDRKNDQFIPFPYRGVKRIDLQVFNRWGKVVFSTTDPAIQWDGTYQDTKEKLPDGVYFYTCIVTFIRLAGEEPVVLKGYVHLLGGRNGSLD
ncbi:MAG: gliding motility-associated C-terminal domain-containing protein [Flavobacteriales bacterium]